MPPTDDLDPRDALLLDTLERGAADGDLVITVHEGPQGAVTSYAVPPSELSIPGLPAAPSPAEPRRPDLVLPGDVSAP